jgi:hypothetical protein
MDNKKSREAAISFLEYVGQKGLMAPATARSRKAAVSKVLGILDAKEALDITTIDLDDVMTRFGHLEGKKYTPDSLNTYKSRVKGALDDFASYLRNPLAFKPGLQARERKPNLATEGKNGFKTPAQEGVRQTASIAPRPMANDILPIPIRADLTVHIQGLPFDLSEAEANKIASVVKAMALSK